MFMTSAPSRLPASSNEDCVRVEASKNRLIWVRPRSEVRFFSIWRLSLTNSSARSSRPMISSGESPSIPNRCRRLRTNEDFVAMFIKARFYTDKRRVPQGHNVVIPRSCKQKAPVFARAVNGRGRAARNLGARAGLGARRRCGETQLEENFHEYGLQELRNGCAAWRLWLLRSLPQARRATAAGQRQARVLAAVRPRDRRRRLLSAGLRIPIRVTTPTHTGDGSAYHTTPGTYYQERHERLRNTQGNYGVSVDRSACNQ